MCLCSFGQGSRRMRLANPENEDWFPVREASTERRNDPAQLWVADIRNLIIPTYGYLEPGHLSRLLPNVPLPAVHHPTIYLRPRMIH